eukprot:GILJ01015389.1.p1 GENE.GILJ01015389.1~~GILJ01015389.1.p1  ORF type:complete len:631 (+),score=61.89 GILJ01015389.1:66-1895(+)
MHGTHEERQIGTTPSIMTTTTTTDTLLPAYAPSPVSLKNDMLSPLPPVYRSVSAVSPAPSFATNVSTGFSTPKRRKLRFSVSPRTASLEDDNMSSAPRLRRGSSVDSTLFLPVHILEKVRQMCAKAEKHSASNIFSTWKYWSRERTLKRERSVLKERVANITKLESDIKEGRLTVSAHDKKMNVHRTFYYLSSFLIVFFVCLLLYYNYQMVSPVLSAILWALMCSVFLGPARKGLLNLYVVLDRVCLPYKVHLISLSIGTFALFCSQPTPAVLISVAIVFLLWLFLVFGDRRTVVAALLVVGVICIIAFPMFFFIKTLVEESREITGRVTSYIEKNGELQKLFEDYSNSGIYLRVRAYIESWGWDLPAIKVADIKAYLVDAVTYLGNHLSVIFGGAFNIMSNLSTLMFSLVTFITCLFYFLQMDDASRSEFSELSPFTPEDNKELISTLKQSIYRIFACSLSVGVLHCAVTYLAFVLCGFDMVLILSFISGFLAMLPLLSSWIVWVPATIGLFLSGQNSQALIMGAMHLVTNFYVDGWIYSYIPGHSTVVGMSIILGLYVFGAIGVLMGPLLAGLTVTVFDIYRKYVSMPMQGPMLPPMTPYRTDSFQM